MKITQETKANKINGFVAFLILLIVAASVLFYLYQSTLNHNQLSFVKVAGIGFIAFLGFISLGGYTSIQPNESIVLTFLENILVL